MLKQPRELLTETVKGSHVHYLILHLNDTLYFQINPFDPHYQTMR